MIESLGGLDKADSPRLKAQLSIIEKAVAEGTLKPEEGLKRVDTLFAEAGKAKQSTRDQAEIVSGIKAESKAGKLPALINYLKTERGYTDAALAPLFKEAGIEMPASPARAATPAAAPAAATKGGATSAAPAEYVPPANSPAGRALAARQQGLVQQSEATAATARAQSALSAQFAADSKVLSPLQMAQKYDAVRRQLPVADAAALQSFERSIR
jgi:hypothetical protein